jgi:hypothetical protein
MITENNKSSETSQFSQFGFVPKRLAIEDRPELDDFPFNVLYVNFFNRGGVNYSATALYSPDLESYRKEEEGRSLDYRNIYGEEDRLTITKKEEGWWGQKFIKDKWVLIAEGKEWNQFFVQLTLPGLSKGERCKFERLDDLPKKTKVN